MRGKNGGKKVKNNPPCYNCIDRASGCHSKCEIYKSWNIERLAKERKIKENKFADLDTEKYVKITKLRMAKHRDHLIKNNGSRGIPHK